MSKQEDKIVEGAQQYLQPGEKVIAAVVAQARGTTTARAGGITAAASKAGSVGAAASGAGLPIANPMGLVLTDQRLMTLRIGTPIGMGLGGAVKDFMGAVALNQVQSIEAKRVGMSKILLLTINGAEIKLEANAAASTDKIAEGFASATA